MTENTKNYENATKKFTNKFDEALELVRGLKEENEKLKEENKRLNAIIKDYIGTLKSLYDSLAGDLDTIIDTIGYERISPVSPATAPKHSVAQPAPRETKKPVPEVKRMTSEEANHYMAEMLMNMFN